MKPNPKHRPRPRMRLTLARDLGPAPTHTRDCPEGPCPFTACRHHLPTVQSRCTIREASRGPRTLDDVGKALGGLSRERVRQIEGAAIAKARANAAAMGLDVSLLPNPAPPSHWDLAGVQWDRGELTSPEVQAAQNRRWRERYSPAAKAAAAQ